MTISPKANRQEADNVSSTAKLVPQLSDLKDDNDDLEFWFGNES
ncbi:hypothetical protein [Vibrio sp. PNB22_4_2]